MRKVVLSIGVMLLVGCSSEEAAVETETENAVADESSSITKEDEFIKVSADYVKENLALTDELSVEFQSLDQAEDEAWQLGVESLSLSLYTQDTPMFLAANDLSAEQKEKFDSTIEQYEKTSSLIVEIKDGIASANTTYDKRKLEEIKQQLPELENELISMKDQLEYERYE